MSTQAFSWSGLRDHRLGRLVAANHYNFEKAADALSDEFMCKVSTEECRRRYTELKTLRDQHKDAPIDESAKQDAAKWWLRKLDKLKGTRDAAAEQKKQKVSATGGQEIKAKIKDSEDTEDPSLFYDVAAVEEQVQMDANYLAQSQAKAKASAEASSNTNASSYLSADASSLLSADAEPSGLSPPKADPCHIPKAFAPPQRPTSELGDLD